MVSKNLNLPLLFLWYLCVALVFPNVFAVPRLFGKCLFQGKLNALKDFWFTFDLFLALLIIVETWVTPTVLLLAGWTVGSTWVDWGGGFWNGRIRDDLEVQLKRWPGKRKRKNPKQLRVYWESMIFCILWDSMPSMNIPNHRYPTMLGGRRMNFYEFPIGCWGIDWRKCNWQTSCRQLSNETSLVV